MSGPYTRFKLDKNNYPFPAVSDVQKQAWSGAPASSSVIGLSPNTTVVEVSAFGGQSANSAILLKWGNVAVTTTNFDSIILSGEQKILAIPQSVFGAQLASVAGANAANGLYNQIAIISATAQVCSVFGVEYGN